MAAVYPNGSSMPPVMKGRLPKNKSLTRLSQIDAATSNMKRSDSAAKLTDTFFDPTTPIEKQRIQIAVEDRLIRNLPIPKVFELKDVLPFVSQGASVIVQDGFWRCFQATPPEPWNWNLYLRFNWIVGTFVRYFILFPLRMIGLLGGTLLFFTFFGLVQCITNKKIREHNERQAIKFACSVFVCSWTGVIKYHGVIPKRQPNQIYVANHSSMIDFIILEQVNAFSAVGQLHKGWVGFLQRRVLSCLGCVWFDRSEAKDRVLAGKRIKEHISNPDSNRMLIFPEGTCVNNEHCIQFKRGAFDMGATICPIAIKYNSIFVDAYWNSRQRSFQAHLFDLMTSWAVVCDVYYLEPMEQGKNETPERFAARVKELICQKANLKNLDWNGYLKYFRPSEKFVEKRRKLFADSLNLKLHSIDEHENEMPASGEDEETLRQRK